MSIWEPYELIVYEGVFDNGYVLRSVLSFATQIERAAYISNNPQYQYKRKPHMKRMEVIKRLFDLLNDVLFYDVNIVLLDGNQQPMESLDDEEDCDFVKVTYRGKSYMICVIGDSASACLLDCMKQIMKLYEEEIL